MKKIICTLLVTAMLVATLFSITIPSRAESLYIRKIVSIVCDDSGSMKGEKWAYGNYALQTFCGMLNSEDQLFITYMNNRSKNGSEDLSASGIQKTVDGIRKTACSSSTTPFSAVETAFQKLKEAKDSNPNTQYWLVVITDGQFDEINDLDSAAQKDYLNKKLGEYVDTEMPNGTKPHVNYLAIGDVISPDKNDAKGIYPFKAANSSEIIGAMSEMADKISGRTRLDSSSIEKIGTDTVRVSSKIPLLNIVVFTQGVDTKLTEAKAGSTKIKISRQATLSFPNYKELSGGAYLIGDEQNVIPEGTYDIKFDKEIQLSQVIVLFEPALEMRMKITLNGRELNDYSELQNAVEGDEITVSCKVYEMGTDNVIDPSLLPANTQYEISVFENGKEVKKATGKEMVLDSYVLKNVNTKIKSSLYIEGFNPITYSTEFTPIKFVPKIVYTVSPESGGSDSIKYKDVASNSTFSVVFNAYADGKKITDPEAVKALKPKIQTSAAGNDGKLTVDSNGRILFTPNSASIPSGAKTSYDVTVTCTIDEGASASKKYTVLLPVYAVVPGASSGSIKLDDVAQNKDFTVYFTVTRDGEQIKDPAAVKALNPQIQLSPAGNDGTLTVDAEGHIVFTPSSAKAPASATDSYDVTVTCTITDGASASGNYTVILPLYEIVAVAPTGGIKYDDLASNKDYSIVFTIYSEGERIKDLELIKSLNPVVDISPSGSSGAVDFGADGQIIFTPDSALVPAQNDGSFEVEVTCKLENGVSTSAKYTVLLAVYQIIPADAPTSVVKTEWFGNTTGVSFYITKDGEKLDKSAVEAGIAGVVLDENHADMLVNISVAPDGTITVVPHSEEPYGLNFWNWGINWIRYWIQDGSNVIVTLEHTYGTASAKVDVVGEDVLYLILNVILPLLEKIAVVIFVCWWIFCICVKPKFDPSTAIYYGSIQLSRNSEGNTYHKILSFDRRCLGDFNTFGYIIKPTLTPIKVKLDDGLVISPVSRGGMIRCHGPVWFKGCITPKEYGVKFGHPEEMIEYIDSSKSGYLKIKKIDPIWNGDVQAVSTLDEPSADRFYICIDGSDESNQITVINDGVIFAYTYVV